MKELVGRHQLKQTLVLNGLWHHPRIHFECTANDAVDAQGKPNGLLGADGNPTTSRGVMCKGAVDSDESVSESIESIYANFNFEHTTESGGEIRAQLGLRYEDVTRSSVGKAACSSFKQFGVLELISMMEKFCMMGKELI